MKILVALHFSYFPSFLKLLCIHEHLLIIEPGIFNKISFLTKQAKNPFDKNELQMDMQKGKEV